MQGTEALLCWNNTLLGSVPPAHFIGLAEETGLIKAIGLWVVREARTQWMLSQQLWLELTESHLMDNLLAAQEQVAALKALGVQVAIDDFGTGYSGLAYLKRVEIDKLKVYPSFVHNMLDDTPNRRRAG